MKIIDLIAATNSLRKRQYVHRKIGAVDTKYVPQSKQLFVSAQAFPTSRGTAPYKVQYVFNGIESSPTKTKIHVLPYSARAGQIDSYLTVPTVNHNVQVRCTCQDFYFMWAWSDKKQSSLVGSLKPYTRKTPAPPVGYPYKNPDDVPGLCKHCLGLLKVLMDNGLVKKNVKVSQFLNRPLRKIL